MEREPIEVEQHPDDMPDGVTFEIIPFAIAESKRVFQPLYEDARAYCRYLDTLPPSYRTFVNSEYERIIDKWKRVDECQPKRQKPRGGAKTYPRED